MKNRIIYLMLFIFVVLSTSVFADVCTNEGFFDRVVSKCKIDNGMCDDGENYLLDDDCNLTETDITSGEIFKQMWFFRLVLIIFIISLLMKKKSVWQTSLVVLIGLLLVTNALGTPGSPDTDKESVNALELSNELGDMFPKTTGLFLVLASWFIISKIVKAKNRKKGRKKK